jgi:hypothetical protein
MDEKVQAGVKAHSIISFGGIPVTHLENKKALLWVTDRDPKIASNKARLLLGIVL